MRGGSAKSPCDQRHGKMKTCSSFHAPIDRPAGTSRSNLRYIASPAFFQPAGTVTETRTAVGPAGIRSVTPALAATATKAGCALALGFRSGGPRLGSTVDSVG